MLTDVAWKGTPAQFSTSALIENQTVWRLSHLDVSSHSAE